MFFENDYLSQPHKHPGARSEDDLHKLALEDWTKPANANKRALFEAQELKQKERYGAAVERWEDDERARETRLGFEALKDRAEREAGEVGRVERERGGGTGAVGRGGFTSING